MKQHRFDPISFIFGLGLTLVGLVFLVPTTPTDMIDLVSRVGAWIWPTALLAVGAAIVFSAVAAAREDRKDS